MDNLQKIVEMYEVEKRFNDFVDNFFDTNQGKEIVDKFINDFNDYDEKVSYLLKRKRISEEDANAGMMELFKKCADIVFDATKNSEEFTETELRHIEKYIDEDLSKVLD